MGFLRKQWEDSIYISETTSDPKVRRMLKQLRFSTIVFPILGFLFLLFALFMLLVKHYPMVWWLGCSLGFLPVMLLLLGFIWWLLSRGE